jgi:quinol monooxygenase YgiN
MSVRLVVTITAKPGKAPALAEGYRDRSRSVREESGCEQFEVFQSIESPDRFVLVERWKDEATLEAHRILNQTLNAGLRELCVDRGEREIYVYNRTR